MRVCLLYKIILFLAGIADADDMGAGSAFGGGHGFHSRNGGRTWTDRGGDLPDIPVNAIEIDPANTSRRFAATDHGVYRISNARRRWIDFSNGLPNAVVGDLILGRRERAGAAYGARFGRSRGRSGTREPGRRTPQESEPSGALRRPARIASRPRKDRARRGVMFPASATLSSLSSLYRSSRDRWRPCTLPGLSSPTQIPSQHRPEPVRVRAPRAGRPLRRRCSV